MPILVNTNGNVVVSGNQKMNATQYDATTIDQLTNGTTNWISQYNSSNQKAFITASCNDASGNLYTVGAIRTNTTNGIDFLVIKLDAAGIVLWVYTYNGPNSTNDVASAVCVDASGNVYVAGASDGSGGTLVDYATIQLNSSGVQQWCTRYDYNSLMDVPTAIELNSTETRLIVTGSSGATMTDWDFATLTYDAATGTQVHSNRTTNVNNAQDKVLGMASDGSGNLYITGTVWNGTDFDVQLVKLDTALTQVWVQSFDGHGFDDSGINLAIDGNNNIIVVGSSYFNSTSRELVVMKYNSGGVLKWSFNHKSLLGQDAEGLRIQINSNNEYFVAGNYGIGNNQDIALLCLDSLGKLTIEKTYDGSGFRDRLMDMVVDSNLIFLSARTMTSSTASVENNITIKYEYKTFTQGVATQTSTGLKYEPKEIIVEFNKAALKLATINNKEHLFGKLNDFVSDSTCDKIQQIIDPDSILRINARSIETRKIFLTLTEADSLSESRMGNYVKVPNYYCYLLLTMPTSISNITASNLINSIKPDVITAGLNAVLELASTASANDPLYNTAQGSLHAITNYPNSNINCDTAWAITSGKPNIKVGVYDSGIDFLHPDFSGLSALGFDFVTNTSLSNVDDSDHGTAVAGVIGAVRNNNIGIAGIAGRDASTANQGVTLYDCKVVAFSTGYISIFAPALVKGLQGTNMNGYALHIMNLSINLGYDYYNNFPYATYGLAIKALNDANRNGVAIVASKGNAQLGAVSVASHIFPGDYSDETTMAVGSTGRDGHHCLNFVNCDNASTVWGNIDFSAPGTDSLVHTLNNTSGYKQESGTSYAAPHVAGAVALMMSYRNSALPNWDNLVHEDCEQILQRTCTDLAQAAVYNEKVGYDSITGFGRINVTEALKKINKNYYRFRHITETIGSTSSTRAVSTISSNVNLAWKNFGAIAPGNYNTDIYELTSTINFNLLPNEQIIDYWPLNKEAYGTKLDTIVVTDRPYYSKIISMTNSSAVLKTYYYKHNPTGNYNPYGPSQIQNAFTLYTIDSTGTVGMHKNYENFKKFAVFPNPSTGIFDVTFSSDYNATLTYKVFNILGQELMTGSYQSQYGINSFKINLSDLVNGIYILNIFDDKSILHKQKIIKN
jgi:hypothetical protein